MSNTFVQQQALAKYEAAVARRRAIEIAQCESVIAGEYSAQLRVDAGLARIHEEVARIQAVSLGALS